MRRRGLMSDYLPWYRKDTGSRMTIEQLLHHTAGLPGDFDQPEFRDGKEAQTRMEPREFVEKICQKNLASEPGTKWEYSNCAYDLLGLILQSVSGRSFEELLRERLLEPIGMKDTGLDKNDLVQKGGARGYVRHAGPKYSSGPDLDRLHLFSGGGMYSTVEDLFLWTQALSDGGFISREVRDHVFQPELNNWGYGWSFTKIPAGQPGAGNTLAEMRGDMPGNYFSWILKYPEQGVVIIVLRNGHGSTENFEQNLQAVLFGGKPRLPPKGAKDVAAQIWIVPADWINRHRAVSVEAAIFAAIVSWMLRQKRKRPLA